MREALKDCGDVREAFEDCGGVREAFEDYSGVGRQPYQAGVGKKFGR